MTSRIVRPVGSAMHGPSGRSTAVLNTPPLSNTGVETAFPAKSVLGFGWLRGTLRSGSGGYFTLTSILSEYFPTDRPFRCAQGTRWYQSAVTLAEGRIMLAWDGVASAQGTTMIDVTQGSLDALGFSRSFALLMALTGAGVRWSRVDIYIDDLQPEAFPRDALAAFTAHQVVTHAREIKRVETLNGSWVGETAYFGTRKSDRMLRIYEKPQVDLVLTSKHPVRVRWELELHNEHARGAVLQVLRLGASDLKTVGKWFWGYLSGFVDFRAERRSDGHGRRSKRLAWFAVLTDNADAIKAVMPVPVASTVDLQRDWIERTVSSTLAKVVNEFGQDWLLELLERKGTSNLTRLDFSK